MFNMFSAQVTKPITRRNALMDKLKQTQKDLKAVAELNKKLLQERDDSEEEVLRVVRTNTTLKTQLAEQDIQYEDMLSQRTELQLSVDRFQQCQEIHEQALQRIRDLKQQLEELQAKQTTICKYCSELGENNLSNNLSIFAELSTCGVDMMHDSLVSAPIVETIDLTNSVYVESNSDQRVVVRGSNKIKKYLKLSRFIKKSKVLLQRHKSIFKAVLSKNNHVVLSDQLLYCQQQLDQAVKDLNNRSDEVKILQSKLKDITSRHDLSSKTLQEYISFMNNVLEPGSGVPVHFESPRVPGRCAGPSHGHLPAGSSPAAPAPASPALRRAAACVATPRRGAPAPPAPPSGVELPPTSQDEPPLPSRVVSPPLSPCRAGPVASPGCAAAPPAAGALGRPRRTAVYSDRAGAGLGALLAGRLTQKVTNDCLPGASIDRLASRISADEFDRDCTLVVLIGESLDYTKREIIKLSEVLADVDRRGIGKIIICALPFSNWISENENTKLDYFNSIFYKLSVYGRTISYFDTNKFVKNFVLTRKRTHLPRRYLRDCANLLAYNIVDSVLTNTICDSFKAGPVLRFSSGGSGTEPAGDLN